MRIRIPLLLVVVSCSVVATPPRTIANIDNRMVGVAPRLRRNGRTGNRPFPTIPDPLPPAPGHPIVPPFPLVGRESTEGYPEEKSSDPEPLSSSLPQRSHLEYTSFTSTAVTE